MKLKRGLFLVTGDSDPLLIEGLKKLGFTVEYNPAISQYAVDLQISSYEGILITTKIQLQKPTLQKAIGLKWILRAGSGMENIDVALAETMGIKCINSPEGNRDAVGEHAVGFLISMLHNIPSSFDEIKNGKWSTEQYRVKELSNLQIGIIGFGNTGEAFAKRLNAFNPTVLAYDKYRSGFGSASLHETSLNEIYNNADVISIHLPLTSETVEFVNHDFFSSFKKNIYFINTSRGKIVNEKDLLSAIQNGKVKGAALDVMCNEENEIDFREQTEIAQMIATKKVIITPHIAGKSNLSREKFAAVLLQKLTDIL